MPAFKNIAGQRFGRLVARSHESVLVGKQKRTVWSCDCDCGNTARVLAANLSRTASCGCLNSEVLARRNRTHGRRRTRLYGVWAGIIARCTYPSQQNYHLYGGRGVVVCPEWRASFEAFAVAVGDPPSGEHSIDRIDNSKGYEPGNVRWATKEDQANNRRSNRILEHGGRLLTLAQWSRETGIPASLILDRVFKRKWTVHDALTKPPRPIKLKSRK
jgi:hypothetical protein